LEEIVAPFYSTVKHNDLDEGPNYDSTLGHWCDINTKIKFIFDEIFSAWTCDSDPETCP